MSETETEPDESGNSEAGKAEELARPTRWDRFRTWIASTSVRYAALAAIIMVGPLTLALLGRWFGIGPDIGIEAAKLVYAWPVVAGICVVVGVVIFRSPLSQLIGGMRRIKAAGLEFEAEQQALPTTARDPRKGDISWEEWFFDLGKRLTDVDQQVLGELGGLQRDAFKQWIQWWWFEKIWGRIYGTQLVVVEALARGGELSLENVISAFDLHVELRAAVSPEFAEQVKVPEERRSYFGHWLLFLENARLIERQEARICRTELTQEFIKYMNSQEYIRNMRIW